MTRDPHHVGLAGRIASCKATVAVVGVGYVGLPLAVALANRGFTVLGIDKDEQLVRRVNSGISHVRDVPSSILRPLVNADRLFASIDFGEVSRADVVVIAVPTPIDVYRVPDLRYVTEAAQSVAEAIRPPALVVLESTTYPGTTEEIVAPAFRSKGFRLGDEILIGYSPERIDPGNETWNIRNTPKVVSGLTKNCLDVTVTFYSCIVDHLVPVSSLRTAETTKLFENIFRIVNIALVNEFQLICDAFGIDVWEVIEACKTKPYGFMPFYPGPGLGGHCVPVDPFYLAWKAREKHANTEFIELAGRINAAMPAHVVGKVARMLSRQQRSLSSARVALLGVSYKKNTPDVRESPAIRIIELLNDAGANVTYHDPHVPSLRVNGHVLLSQPLTPGFLSANDCAVVVTDHDSIDWTLVLQYAPVTVDTRNVFGRLAPVRVDASVPELSRASQTFRD